MLAVAVAAATSPQPDVLRADSAFAGNRQTADLHLRVLICRLLQIADFDTTGAARLLAGGDDPNLLKKCQRRIAISYPRFAPDWSPNPRWGCGVRSRASGKVTQRSSSLSSTPFVAILSARARLRKPPRAASHPRRAARQRSSVCPNLWQTAPARHGPRGSCRGPAGDIVSRRHPRAFLYAVSRLTCPSMEPTTYLGRTIAGKYLVERVLGQGGMGVVVAARHLVLGERVAIKFPAAPIGERGVSDRLVSEARAMMKIRSEHVARVFDVGMLETGTPYLVMEYLVGSDLAAVVAKDGPLPIHVAVDYVLQAVEALAEAHARGIIHRDLKPSNLFLSRRADGSPVVRVIDFGLSKTSASSAEAGVSNRDGAFGTPLYMAPEQMESTGAIDARCDIWALGATLHALVTGEPPFAGGSVVQIFERILQGAPRLRDVLPEAPIAVEAALLRCMQREPEARFATVAELAEALAEGAPEHAQLSVQRAARILSAPPAEADAGVDPGDVASESPLAPPARTSAGLKASWLEVGPYDVTVDASRDTAKSFTGNADAGKVTAPQTGRRFSAAAVLIALITVLGLAWHHDRRSRAGPFTSSTKSTAGLRPVPRAGSGDSGSEAAAPPVGTSGAVSAADVLPVAPVAQSARVANDAEDGGKHLVRRVSPPVRPTPRRGLAPVEAPVLAPAAPSSGDDALADPE